jgi:hypothetical protein
MTTETKATHTPGPWKYESEDSYSLTIYGWDNPGHSARGRAVVVATIRNDDVEPPTPSQEANASLISAAPELLETCQSILSRLGDHPMHDDELADTLRDAIAKATGEAACRIAGFPGFPGGWYRDVGAETDF